MILIIAIAWTIESYFLWQRIWKLEEQVYALEERKKADGD